MKTDLLQQLIKELLEPGMYKTTAQLVEEFRIENPECWKQLKREGELIYGKGCSSEQQPSTRIAQILLSLPDDQCLRRFDNNEYFWSKPV